MEDTLQELEFLDLGGLSEEEKLCLQSYLEGSLSPKPSQNGCNSTTETNYVQTDKDIPISSESCVSPAFQNAAPDHMTVPITVGHPAPSPVHVYNPNMYIATTLPQYQHMSYPMPMLSGAPLMSPNYFMGPPNPAIMHPGPYHPQANRMMNQQQFPRKMRPPRIKYSPRKEVPNGHAGDGFAGVVFPSPPAYASYYPGHIVQAATGAPLVMPMPYVPQETVGIPEPSTGGYTTMTTGSYNDPENPPVRVVAYTEPAKPPKTTYRVTPSLAGMNRSSEIAVKEEKTPPPPVLKRSAEEPKKQESQTPAPVAVQADSSIAKSAKPNAAPLSSWASLFKKDVEDESDYEKPTARVEPYTTANETAPAKPTASTSSTPAQDPHIRSLAEFLSKYQLHPSPLALLPRGLTNKGNWCYINATLQALVACSPFVHLMKSLIPYVRSKSTESTPIIESVLEFIEQFETVPVKSTKDRMAAKKEDPHIGTSFEPSSIYKALSKIRSETFKVEGRQEDAEEFLSCLLNALHDEMIEVIKGDKGDLKPAELKQNGQDEDDWQVIGPKNRGCVTHTTAFSKTPISNLFLGQMRSAVHYAGAQSAATLQPFFSLQLDIQSDKIKCVYDALDALVSREPLTGYVCPKTGKEVEASRQITLEELPTILILHFKCFVYDKSGGIQKLMKRVAFNADLELSKEFLSPSLNRKLKGGQKSYKLFAVVYHEGKEATKGHYITDVHHAGVGGWLRFDDSSVRVIDSQEFKYNPPRMPYLLLYRKLYM